MNKDLSSIDEFRESLEDILAGKAVGLFNAANDLRRLNKAQAIEVMYASAIDHGVQEALLNFGNFLVENNRLDEAITQYKKAHQAGDKHASFALGQTFLQLNQPAAAIHWLLKAKDNPYTPLRLAMAYRASGEEESAVNALRCSKEESPEAAVELIQTTDELDINESIHLLERHLEKGSLEVLIPLAELYSQTGRKAESIELLQRSVSSGEPNALHNLGLALWEYGEFTEGERTLKRAAQLGDELAVETLKEIKRTKRQRN